MYYSSQDLGDTIVALSTPSGTGAIGVIRISGPQAIEIVNGIFPSKDLKVQQSHTLHFGVIRDENGQTLDEVVAGLFVGPNSYTGEHVIEISCHGSNYILQQVIQLLVRQGARLAQAGEFTMRAFLNGKMDLSQAEAVADLIASDSESSHQLALRQMRGGFSSEILELRQQLIDFASLIELELDFSEEDVEFANRAELKKLVQKIQGVIQGLMQSFELGNAIKQGVNTVIAGRPNAGKSTLLNALLNEERAIVSDIAGTTRDTIEEVLNIKGVQFRMIDTAGIRQAQDQIEAVGVERTYEKIRQSAVLIYVFDVIRTQPEEVQADLQDLVSEGMEVLIVANKMDLNPYTKWEHYSQDGGMEYEVGGKNGKNQGLVTKENFIPISALNQMNLEYLKERIYETAIGKKLDQQSTIVSNVRHIEALQQAQESLDAVLNGLESGISSDFIAMDIRRSLSHLGSITGAVTTDDLLGNIFGKFCIGK